jgi:ABC-type nitrate/sulfonate/bicarbonate transport system permease component
LREAGAASTPKWKESVRTAWRDAAISAGALGIIFLVLVSFDSRVREQVQLRLSSPSAVVNEASHGLRSLATEFMYTLREQRLDQTSLVVFVIGAAILLVFMLRT